MGLMDFYFISFMCQKIKDKKNIDVSGNLALNFKDLSDNFCSSIKIDLNGNLIDCNNGRDYKFSSTDTSVEVSIIGNFEELENCVTYAKFDFINANAKFNIVQGDDLIIFDFNQINEDGFYRLDVYGYNNIVSYLQQENIKLSTDLNLKSKIGVSYDFGQSFVVDILQNCGHVEEMVEPFFESDYFVYPDACELDVSNMFAYSTISKFLIDVADDSLTSDFGLKSISTKKVDKKARKYIMN